MRQNVEAPYLRGEATRSRVLKTAVTLFATKGFDSVSTREIAAAADVPQASLRYYFETKQGLYIACLEQIQAGIVDHMQPALILAEAVLATPEIGPDQIIDSFCTLQEAMFDAMVGQADAGTTALFVIRHDLPSDGGAGALSGDEAAVRQIANCFTNMLVRLSEGRLDAQSASRIAGLINGQITNIYLRRSRLHDAGWDLTPERLVWIKRMIRQQTAAMLQTHHHPGHRAGDALHTAGSAQD